MSVKLNLPRLMEESKYRGLSSLDQEEYIERKIKEIINLNSEGATVPEIESNTPFTRPTIFKHLEKMVAGREAYKLRRGRLSIYYPNGKLVQSEAKIEKKSLFGDTHYRATFLDNAFGKFVFIEEMNTKRISGGSILIKLEDLPLFKNLVDEIFERGKEYGNLEDKGSSRGPETS